MRRSHKEKVAQKKMLRFLKQSDAQQKMLSAITAAIQQMQIQPRHLISLSAYDMQQLMRQQALGAIE